MATIHRVLAGRCPLWALLIFALLGRNPAGADESGAVLALVAEDIRYLASDELEGRGPGTAGLQRAAEYIRDEFVRLGLTSGVPDGSYLQPFQFPLDTRVVPEATQLVLQGPAGQALVLERGQEFQALAVGGSGQVKAEVVFAGYGISAPDLKYDDYAGLDVAGKIVLVIRREPQQDDPQSAFQGKRTTPHAYVRTKLEAAKQHGAAAVLFVNDPFSTRAARRDQLAEPSAFGTVSLGIPFAQLSQASAERMLQQSPLAVAEGEPLGTLAEIEAAIDRDYRPLSQPLSGWTAELHVGLEAVQADVANVIGVLEGQGPRAHETIILGAHYDHLGYGGYGSRRPNERVIHNGADDNASGTAAILELARRFAARPEPPPRRLVFIAFSAEERGLLGSRHYLEHPSVPLADTVAMLNYDMIGRLRNGELTVSGVRTASEFDALLDAAGEDRAGQNGAEHGSGEEGGSGGEGGGLQIKKQPRVVASGDHFGFFQRDIPSLHFFTGLTEDYHTPEDDFDKINMPGVLQIIDLSERFLDSLLAQQERPQWVAPGGDRAAGGGMAYLGITPDYSAEAAGLRVVSVADGSPAERGGLRAGDVIVRYGDAPVADLPALAAGLRKNKPGDIVYITVQREQETVVCSVTLGSPAGQ